MNKYKVTDSLSNEHLVNAASYHHSYNGEVNDRVFFQNEDGYVVAEFINPVAITLRGEK